MWSASTMRTSAFIRHHPPPKPEFSAAVTEGFPSQLNGIQILFKFRSANGMLILK